MTAPIPAEWHRQRRLYTAWPSHHELWPGDLLAQARTQIAVMINAIAESQPFTVLVHGDEAHAAARKQLSSRANIERVAFGDIWLRDTGPIFAADGTALRFAHNGWGEKYIYSYDDSVGDDVARLSAAAIRRFPFVLEGGALEHNGEGTILTTRQCLLNPNRNGWQEAQAAQALMGAFDAQRVCWLGDGIAFDHTDGHIDNLARFVAGNTVLCQTAFGEDDPNAQLYARTAADLHDMGFNVVTVPSPGRILDADGAVMPASHMNFIIANEVVVVPVYGASHAVDATLDVLRSLFPGRQVIAGLSTAVLTGGGSFHCITQQEPEHD